MRAWHVAMLALALAVNSAVWAQDRLKPGDSAPAIDVQDWVLGPPVGVTPGRVTIVIFWATTSPAAPPLFAALSDLQKALPLDDVAVVAISEEDDDVVRKFVGRFKERLNISIGTDKGRRTSGRWLAQREGKDADAPAAFIIGVDGRIAYIGSPIEEKFGDVLNRVYRGRFDPKLEREQGPKLEAARRARKIKNWKLTIKMYDEVLASNRKVFADVALEKFDLMLVDMDDPKTAYAYAATLMEEYSTDPQFLTDFAKKIVTDPNIPEAHRRLDLALRAATTALDIVREADRPNALAAVALVHFHQHDLAKAVAVQREAWFRAGAPLKPSFKRVLDSYQDALSRSEAK